MLDDYRVDIGEKDAGRDRLAVIPYAPKLEKWKNTTLTNGVPSGGYTS